MKLAPLSGGLWVSALSLASQLACANSYSIVDLGTEAGPVAINDAGELAGNGSGAGNGSRAKEYRGGRWHNLSAQSSAYAINQRGDVIGTKRTGYSEPMLWQPNKPPKVIPYPGPSYYGGQGRGVRSDRTVVGVYIPLGTEFSHCFVWSPHGGSVDIGLMDGGVGCYATAANDVGGIAGVATGGDGREHAFVWKDSVFTDMGTLQAFEGVPFPRAINDPGTSVGHVNGHYTIHAFLWDGRMIDLDPNRRYVATDARSINNAGEVVGNASSTEEIDDGEAVRFTRTKIVRLQDEITNLGKWQWLTASAINNLGEIVGSGYNGDTNRWSAFMLVPAGQR